MSNVDENLKELLEILTHGDEEVALELLAKFDGFIRNASYSAPGNWNDDLAQDVRITVYEWLRQMARKAKNDGMQEEDTTCEA